MAATNPTTATMVDRKHEAFSLLPKANPWRFEPTALTADAIGRFVQFFQTRLAPLPR
jgi:hypothetical protein